VGVLAGHTDGITYIDTRGDGRFILSNSKDQVRHTNTDECLQRTEGMIGSSVVYPNRLCLDPDPSSRGYSDLDPALKTHKIRTGFFLAPA